MALSSRKRKKLLKIDKTTPEGIKEVIDRGGLELLLPPTTDREVLTQRLKFLGSIIGRDDLVLPPDLDTEQAEQSNPTEDEEESVLKQWDIANACIDLFELLHVNGQSIPFIDKSSGSAVMAVFNDTIAEERRAEPRDAGVELITEPLLVDVNSQSISQSIEGTITPVRLIFGISYSELAPPNPRTQKIIGRAAILASYSQAGVNGNQFISVLHDLVKQTITDRQLAWRGHQAYRAVPHSKIKRMLYELRSGGKGSEIGFQMGILFGEMEDRKSPKVVVGIDGDWTETKVVIQNNRRVISTDVETLNEINRILTLFRGAVTTT